MKSSSSQHGVVTPIVREFVPVKKSIAPEPGLLTHRLLASMEGMPSTLVGATVKAWFGVLYLEQPLQCHNLLFALLLVDVIPNGNIYSQ